MLAIEETQRHLGSNEASAVYVKNNSQFETCFKETVKHIQTAAIDDIIISNRHSKSHDSVHCSFTCLVVGPKLVKSLYFVDQCLCQQDLYRKLLSLC